jgi:hypothetical protein
MSFCHFFRFSLISEKLDVLLPFLKFFTSLLLLALTVVTGISAVAGYLLFQASCCCSLLLQEAYCCKAAYLAIQLLLTSLLCELCFLLLQILDFIGVLLLQEPYSPGLPVSYIHCCSNIQG